MIDLKRPEPNYDVPALVIGSAMTALGTIRSLGKAGIATYFLPDCENEEESGSGSAKYSRWLKKVYSPIESGICEGKSAYVFKCFYR